MSPIYRAETVQASMSSEPGEGGTLDYISAINDAADWTALLNGAIAAGSRSITFDTASGTLAVGNYVAIGTGSNEEVRKISHLGTYNGTAATGTVYLDIPTGFYHRDNEVVDEKTNGGITGTSLVTFVPGVYADFGVHARALPNGASCVEKPRS